MATSGALVPYFNLPPQPTHLTDRDAELALLGTLHAQKDVGLLTLTGPAGVGKTRLAIAAAELVREHFPGGNWFVDSMPLADPNLVLPAIVRALEGKSVRSRRVARRQVSVLSRAALQGVDIRATSGRT